MFYKNRTIRYVESILDELVNKTESHFIEHCSDAKNMKPILKAITAGLMQIEDTVAYDHAIRVSDKLQTLYQAEPSIRASLEKAWNNDANTVQQLESTSLRAVLRTKLFCDHIMIITDDEERRDRDEARMAM